MISTAATAVWFAPFGVTVRVVDVDVSSYRYTPAVETSEARRVAPDGPDVMVVSESTTVTVTSPAEGADPNADVVRGDVAA